MTKATARTKANNSCQESELVIISGGGSTAIVAWMLQN